MPTSLDSASSAGKNQFGMSDGKETDMSGSVILVVTVRVWFGPMEANYQQIKRQPTNIRQREVIAGDASAARRHDPSRGTGHLEHSEQQRLPLRRWRSG